MLEAEIDLHAPRLLISSGPLHRLCYVISPQEAQHIRKHGETNSGNLFKITELLESATEDPRS